MILNIIKILLVSLVIGTHQITADNDAKQDTKPVTIKDNNFDQNKLELDREQNDKNHVETTKVNKNQAKTSGQIKPKQQEKIVVNSEKQAQKMAKEGQKAQVQKKQMQAKAAQHTQIQRKQEQKKVEQKIEYHEVVVPDVVKIQDPEAKAHHTIQEQQIQIQKKKEEQQYLQDNIRPWIRQQIQNSQQQKEGIIYQTFQFILQPYAQYIFRWNPPHNEKLYISIAVSQVTSQGYITNYMHNQKEEYILVQYKDINNNLFQQIEKVYFYKVFTIDFNTDYKYFRFTNNIRTTAFVVVQLEKKIQTLSKINITIDDHFSVPLRKIEVIEQQVVNQQKLREHSYKWEWGFLQNHFHHQSSMLGFTGVQLLVIIGSALVQLYFIKSLLDNRAIV